MKKNLLVVSIFAMALLFCSSVFLNAQIQTLEVGYLAPETITVDGSDSDWAGVDSVPLLLDILGTLPEAPDFAAYYKAGWDEENLYLVISITDDTLMSALDSSRIWDGDHVELCFTFVVDSIFDVREKGDPDASPDDAKFMIGLDPEFPAIMTQFKQDGEEVEYATLETETGFVVETRIAFEEIYEDAEIMNGSTMRITIGAGDSEDGANRANQLRWSTMGNVNRDFTDFGEFTFVGMPTGVGPLADLSQEFSVYPNPASDMVRIKSSDQVSKVEIYSVTGNLIQVTEGPLTSGSLLDVSHLKAGMYLVKASYSSVNRFAISRLVIR